PEPSRRLQAGRVSCDLLQSVRWSRIRLQFLLSLFLLQVLANRFGNGPEGLTGAAGQRRQLLVRLEDVALEDARVSRFGGQLRPGLLAALVGRHDGKDAFQTHLLQELPALLGR